MKKITFLLLGIILLGLTLGCQSKKNNQEVSCSNCGIFPDKIVIGSSLALTGHAGYLGTQFLKGSLAYLKKINNQGGIFGRKVVLRYYDDGYDPPRCLYNTQRLIIKDKVFALFDYVGTPTTVKVLPFIQEAQITLMGMFTGANRLRKPFNPYLINIRPSYYAETKEAVRHLVEDLHLTKIAIFYQYDAYGFDGLTGTELALGKYNLEPVARASYVRGTLDVETAWQKIWAAEPEAIVMIGTYNPCAKFMTLTAQKGLKAIFYALSFVGANELAKKVQGLNLPVVMSQVVPPPTSIDPNDQDGYLYLLHKYFPKSSPSFVGLEGFINAKVLAEGLKRSGPQINRQKFLKAIYSLHAFDLGYGIKINFGPKDNQGLDKIYFTYLRKGKFRLITNWNEDKLLP